MARDAGAQQGFSSQMAAQDDLEDGGRSINTYEMSIDIYLHEYIHTFLQTSPCTRRVASCGLLSSQAESGSLDMMLEDFKIALLDSEHAHLWAIEVYLKADEVHRRRRARFARMCVPVL